MKYIIVLLSFTIVFTQELEVAGDLKVTGNIDAQNNPIKNVGVPQELTDAINGNVLQDALRDDGPFEYMFVHVLFYNADSHSSQFDVQYRLEGVTGWTNDFYNYLGTLSTEGWLISKRLNMNYTDNYGVYFVYELIRKIEE